MSNKYKVNYLEVEQGMRRDDSTSSFGSVTLRPYTEVNWDECSVAMSQAPLAPQMGESPFLEEPDRGNWTGKFDFLLSLLGYSVGLGNVWRFPYLCYKNGGGAFLLPFVIMLVVAGLPLMFMELSLGQYVSLGPIGLFEKLCPLLHGLGWGMVIISSIVMLYYNMIIAWTLFYMFASWTSVIPWTHCEPEWSTETCYSYEDADNCMKLNGTYYNRSCFDSETSIALNLTLLVQNRTKETPASQYFNNYVLGLSEGIESSGEPRWQLVLCLLLAWSIVFLCLSKGVQTSGKVVYFTALFPYVVLVILFFRGVTLPGAGTGIIYYLTPSWDRLTSAEVWGDAAVQIFFALSPAWGGLITLASYNKFNNNCLKDAVIVAISNVMTSFFAGFVVFAVIGYLAYELDKEIKHVVDDGAGLAFVVYPQVVTRLPLAPLWAFLFFFMLLTLGLDSQFALMETVTTALMDFFPMLRIHKVLVVAAVSFAGFLGGIIFCTNGGVYWLQLMDHYAANWSVLLIATAECVLMGWWYGAENFLRDIQEMMGKMSPRWVKFWAIVWKYITPVVLMFVLVFNWIQYEPASFGENYVFPLWANVIGWCTALTPMAAILLIAIHKFCTAEGTFLHRLWTLMLPTSDWGPEHSRKEALSRPASTIMNGHPSSGGMFAGLNHGLPSIPEIQTSHEDDQLSYSEQAEKPEVDGEKVAHFIFESSM
ncbi:unnamed protein product [Darwinula stevensoni]|uniref:Transporter n=1 Tax=Darwinula stevensoni TaxID=69355 RepID=A0A7R8X7G7_9CRUS|nr:unnamed protein product [Darwinula stevensoni]CAG0880461.1 unnamed protein product [Darwinula stevensoni]